jgi:hypothetical protein
VGLEHRPGLALLAVLAAAERSKKTGGQHDVALAALDGDGLVVEA